MTSGAVSDHAQLVSGMDSCSPGRPSNIAVESIRQLVTGGVGTLDASARSAVRRLIDQIVCVQSISMLASRSSAGRRLILQISS